MKKIKKNFHSIDVNKKRTFFRPKFEVILMIAGGIYKAGLSNLVFFSGIMNDFSYKQFLLFIQKVMEEINNKYGLKKDLLFQQNNASCFKCRDSLEAIQVLFRENKIWWPCNSPDLSSIETVLEILKQELSKKKITTLEELRNNIIEIWSKFPTELCENIFGELDEKIKICKMENMNIINKITMQKYFKKKVGELNNYDWDIIKKENIFRVVYNDKIIKIIKKRTINNIKKMFKRKNKRI